MDHQLTNDPWQPFKLQLPPPIIIYILIECISALIITKRYKRPVALREEREARQRADWEARQRAEWEAREEIEHLDIFDEFDLLEDWDLPAVLNFLDDGWAEMVWLYGELIENDLGLRRVDPNRRVLKRWTSEMAPIAEEEEGDSFGDPG